MSDKPILSVLMSVHNGQYFLAECIESIINQTFKDFEFIIIDDGSTDDSINLIRAYAKKDSRIRIYENKRNIGLSASLNRGLALCKGEYIARMDADDFSHVSRLEKQLKYLNRNPLIGLVSVGRHYIAPNRLIFDTKIYPDNHHFISKSLIKGKNILDHGCVMFRRELISKMVEVYRFYYSQDFDLWLRLMDKTKFGMIEEPLHFRRRTMISISSTLQNKRNKISDLILELYLTRISNESEFDWKSKEQKILSGFSKNTSFSFSIGHFYDAKAWFVNKSFRKSRIAFSKLVQKNPKNGIFLMYFILSCMGILGYLIWKAITSLKNQLEIRV